VDGVQAACGAFAEKLIPADAYGWYLFRPHSVDPIVVSARGVSDRFLELYEKEGRFRDPLFRRLWREHRAICSDFDLDVEELQAFAFQAEISSGYVTRAIEAPLVIAGEVVGTLNIARNPESRRFNSSDVQHVATIARHASTAIARVRREIELETRCGIVEASLDALSLAIVVTGSDSEIIFANRSTDRLLETRASELASLLRTTSEILAKETQNVATARVSCAPRRCESSSRPRITAAVPTELVVRSTRSNRAGVIISFFYETAAKRDPHLAALSPREQQIADFVVRGLTNTQIATAASISCNTVKQHLKHVFEKCNVGSRTELAALVVAGRAIADADMTWAPSGVTFQDDQGEVPSSVAVDPSRPQEHP
jgi:DNA-binding CsgD family transcriptional regulator